MSKYNLKDLLLKVWATKSMKMLKQALIRLEAHPEKDQLSN